MLTAYEFNISLHKISWYRKLFDCGCPNNLFQKYETACFNAKSNKITDMNSMKQWS
jgi:hypothetical protein